jgi:hypothetical protein
MANEVEVERLVTRLMGDDTEYKQMLDRAAAETKAATDFLGQEASSMEEELRNAIIHGMSEIERHSEDAAAKAEEAAERMKVAMKDAEESLEKTWAAMEKPQEVNMNWGGGEGEVPEKLEDLSKAHDHVSHSAHGMMRAEHAAAHGVEMLGRATKMINPELGEGIEKLGEIGAKAALAQHAFQGLHTVLEMAGKASMAFLATPIGATLALSAVAAGAAAIAIHELTASEREAEETEKAYKKAIEETTKAQRERENTHPTESIKYRSANAEEAEGAKERASISKSAVEHAREKFDIAQKTAAASQSEADKMKAAIDMGSGWKAYEEKRQQFGIIGGFTGGGSAYKAQVKLVEEANLEAARSQVLLNEAMGTAGKDALKANTKELEKHMATMGMTEAQKKQYELANSKTVQDAREAGYGKEMDEGLQNYGKALENSQVKDAEEFTNKHTEAIRQHTEAIGQSSVATKIMAADNEWYAKTHQHLTPTEKHSLRVALEKEQSKQTAFDVSKSLRSLNEETAAAGENAMAKYRITLANKTLADGITPMYKTEDQATMALANDNKIIATTTIDLLDKMRDQAAVYGMCAADAENYKLSIAGIPEEIRMHILALHEQADALASVDKQMKEQMAKAVATGEKYATPLEKYQKGLEDLQKQFDAGLDTESYERALNGLQEQLAKDYTVHAKVDGVEGATWDSKHLQEVMQKYQQTVMSTPDIIKKEQAREKVQKDAIHGRLKGEIPERHNIQPQAEDELERMGIKRDQRSHLDTRQAGRNLSDQYLRAKELTDQSSKTKADIEEKLIPKQQLIVLREIRDALSRGRTGTTPSMPPPSTGHDTATGGAQTGTLAADLTHPSNASGLHFY